MRKKKRNKTFSKVSRHGKKRVIKRIVHRKSVSEKIVKNARIYGVPKEEVGGEFRMYLDKRCYSQNDDPYVIIYNGHIFLFSRKNYKLITTYAIPGRLMKQAIKVQKKFD